jgi:hypothetical protein
MDIRVEYGIICQRKNEKEIVKRINNFLKKEYGYIKMEKRNEETVSEFNSNYYYCQLAKEKPLWYFELYPNARLGNRIQLGNKKVEWILYINKQSVDNNTEKENEQVNVFFAKLMETIDYETVVLYEYKNDSEERIENI